MDVQDDFEVLQSSEADSTTPGPDTTDTLQDVKQPLDSARVGDKQDKIVAHVVKQPPDSVSIGHGEKQDDNITTQDVTQLPYSASTVDRSNDDMKANKPARQVISDEDTAQTLQYEVEDQRNSFMENLTKWNEDGQPLSVLTVGLPGVGKSSYINTLAAALSGCYMEICMVGGGDRESVSQLLTVRKKCGLVDYMKNDKKINSICKYPIPTLIDVPGLPIQVEQQSSPGLVEAIRAMLYGRIKDRTKIVGKEGLLGMTEKDIRRNFPYKQCDKKMMPDIVFVVVSAPSALPESLIRGIMEAAKPLDDQHYQTSFQVFGVITHVDKVDQESEEYKSKREQFINLLNMKGREWALLETENYVNVSPGETVPTIDRRVLKFLSKVTVPGVRSERGHEDEIRKFQKEEGLSWKKTLIIAMGVIVTLLIVMIKPDPLIVALCIGILFILVLSMNL